MTTTENKKVFVELIFWLTVSIVLTMLFSFVKAPNINLAQRIFFSVRGSVLFAVVITGLNRLLRQILNKVG